MISNSLVYDVVIQLIGFTILSFMVYGVYILDKYLKEEASKKEN